MFAQSSSQLLRLPATRALRSARSGRAAVANQPRRVAVSAQVREIFMPALSSTMTGMSSTVALHPPSPAEVFSKGCRERY